MRKERGQRVSGEQEIPGEMTFGSLFIHSTITEYLGSVPRYLHT